MPFIRVDVVPDQYVRAGAALLELDPTDYRIALAQAQAALAAAQAQVRVSQAALVAQQQQYTTGLGAARTSLQATQPSVPQAVAQLHARRHQNHDGERQPGPVRFFVQSNLRVVVELVHRRVHRHR